MYNYKISVEQAILLMAKHPIAVSVLSDGNRYQVPIISVRQKLPYATEIAVCPEGSKHYRTSHALMITTGNFVWYIETDRNEIKNFWKRIALN